MTFFENPLGLKIGSYPKPPTPVLAPDFSFGKFLSNLILLPSISKAMTVLNLAFAPDSEFLRGLLIAYPYFAGPTRFSCISFQSRTSRFAIQRNKPLPALVSFCRNQSTPKFMLEHIGLLKGIIFLCVNPVSHSTVQRYPLVERFQTLPSQGQLSPSSNFLVHYW